MMPVLFAETYLSWLPAWSNRDFAILGGICVATWICLRIFWGKSLVQKRIGLVLLRCCSVALIAIILAGPTMIDEEAGEVTRPSMLYVMDGSQSMQLGKDESRWEAGLRFVQEAETAAGAAESKNTQAFRFGHQLQPLQLQTQSSSSEVSNSISFMATAAAADDVASGIAPPTASDSRLADALRQLLPQVSASSTAGVVLLSDGRVRATDTVEQLAAIFGKADVPLHVVPTGEATGTGDIAVVSLVVPSRVRKYTENELQVFLRSFGFTGQRTTVRVTRKNSLNSSDNAVLAEIPITLRGGAQSVPMTFRVDESPEDLVISVEPIKGELTDRNNSVETRVEINRTKVRVLFVAGELNQTQSIFGGFFGSSSPQISGDGSGMAVRSALQADEDVECTVLLSSGGRSPMVLNATGSSTMTGFPATRAELFAYDCVVFSNVGPDVLEDEQVEWLTQWVQGRGGGLIVTGSRAMDWQSWQDSPLEPLLPLSLSTARPATAAQYPVTVIAPRHPIWRLQLEETLNNDLLEKLPPLQIGVLDYVAKPTAEILATKSDAEDAVIMAHRAGRGRVLASVADLGEQDMETLSAAWGPQPERVAAKLWRNMVYWATEGSSTGRRRLIARSDKRFYRPGDSLTISGTAFDEGARQTQKYRVWAMFEPASLDDMSLYSPLLWPENVVRESGEVGPRIAWGEELKLASNAEGNGYEALLQLSEIGSVGDSGFRIEMTAYEGEDTGSSFNHGTQVDSTSVAIQILSDPFEQQNPLPNHELLHRLAAVSGGQVLEQPEQLAALLKQRTETLGPPSRELSPAWSQWWLWLGVLACLSTEWVWRRITGLA